jgi:hypothetical protein
MFLIFFLKRWFSRLLFYAVFLTMLSGIAAFIFTSTQQERIGNMVAEEVNKQIKGELTIESSKVSMFKHFPHVSIVLQNCALYGEKSKQGKPISEIERLYVGLSLFDILKGDYTLRKISLQGGYLVVVQDTVGKINLLEAVIVADSSAQTESDTASIMSLNLEKVAIEAFKVSFSDKASGNYYSTGVEELSSSLNMESNLLKLDLMSKLNVSVATATDSTALLNKPVELDIEADYELNSRLLEIADCNFRFHKTDFNITGSIDISDTTDLDLKIKGDEDDFHLFTAFIPRNLQDELEPFEYDGRLHFDASIKGKVSDQHQPLVEVTFGCSEAWFLNTEANKKVDQLGFKGYFTNGVERSLKTSELHITNVNARPEKGIFKGHFVVKDFTDPKMLVQINSELELKFLGEFLGIHDLKQTEGTIKLEMDFKELTGMALPEQSLNKLKEGIQSKLTVQNLTFKIPGYPHVVQNMNAHASMQDGRITIDSASLKIGESDITINGSVSDVRAFLRERTKPIELALHVGSHELKLSNLLAFDTALARQWNEEVHNFNISLGLQTTVQELLNPSPLPRGTFEMKNLRGTFKNYAHTVKDLGATVIITDTLLRLRDFTGMIDSTDINFKGRVSQYHLWFDDIKKGKTQIAFDFKSNKFALRDVFSKEIRAHLPRGYRREELNNVWLRAKIDLRYDTIFRFMKAKVSNISADLKRHKVKLHEISGGVKYGSKILSFDTLRGKVGNSDFDVNLKYYFKGIDRYNKKIANSLQFKSKFLDADELSHYDLAPKQGTAVRDSTGKIVAYKPDSTSVHAQAFNIFIIPFSDFNTQIDIAKLRYNELLLEDIDAKISMRQDQTITIDTLVMKAADGIVAGSGKLDGRTPEKIYFRSRISFGNVDLEKMLLKLDHFGQDVVVNKNVKGRLNGQIISYVQVHPNLVPIVNNSKAEMTLAIYNGSLVNFAPMQAMAGYFKDKNLNLIRFDTLQNTLTFTNGVLDIPAMSINSSLGFIQLAGKQSLDLSMEYYLRVPMKMVTKVGFSTLFNRKQEEVDLAQVDEIEYIDPAKKIAFMNLKVTGTSDGNYAVGLGKNKGKKI